METTIMGYILGVIPEVGGPRWQEGPDRLIDPEAGSSTLTAMLWSVVLGIYLAGFLYSIRFYHILTIFLGFPVWGSH